MRGFNINVGRCAGSRSRTIEQPNPLAPASLGIEWSLISEFIGVLSYKSAKATGAEVS